MKTRRALLSTLLQVCLFATAGCKPGNQPGSSSAQPTPNPELKAISERQRQSILRTAEALRKQQEQQGSATPTATPAK